jgi:membrane-associated phospholipid phosphatase
MDEALLRLINGLHELPGVAQLGWLVDRPWAPLLVLLGVIVVSVRGRRWLEIPGALAAVLIADPLCARVLKPLFARPRPCAELDWVIAPFGCGSGLSMPSCHAANLFAIAMVLNRPWAFALATLLTLTRSITGEHYPSDLLAGAVLGLAIGWGVRLLMVMLQRNLRPRPRR